LGLLEALPDLFEWCPSPVGVLLEEAARFGKGELVVVEASGDAARHTLRPGSEFGQDSAISWRQANELAAVCEVLVRQPECLCQHGSAGGPTVAKILVWPLAHGFSLRASRGKTRNSAMAGA
jgi:hypothetical protein